MNTRTLTTAITLVLMATLATAQTEPNDPTGALRSDGADPTPGTPFTVTSAAATMNLEISGISGASYILAMGTHMNNGVSRPMLNFQVLHLDTTAPVIVIGDGIGGSGILPPAFFQLDSTGMSQFAFPTSAAASGMRFGFQAFTTDPAFPFGLNLTAGVEFEVNDVVLTNVIPLMTATGAWAPGDDGIYVHDLLLGGFSFYGNVGTQITISSNGWIRFDGTATNSDSFSDTGRFLDGTVGGGAAGVPVIAALWGDLDFTAAFTGLPSQGSITIEEDLVLNTLKVSFINGGYIFGGGFGDVLVAMDFSMPAPLVELDYTNYANQFQQGFLFVGASDGDSTVGVDVETDMVTGGVVNTHTATTPYETYYQDFGGNSGAVPGEFEDLTGLIIHMADMDSAGQGVWAIY